MLVQQVVQQAGIFQPESCHVYILTMFLQMKIWPHEKKKHQCEIMKPIPHCYYVSEIVRLCGLCHHLELDTGQKPHISQSFKVSGQRPRREVILPSWMKPQHMVTEVTFRAAFMAVTAALQSERA